ncbi:uncharacterized protein [Aegilops tauschii subsp. strangulata]|uniref:uncharacterized protein isoform X2 n=1 Tax=Triticum aestivum TaxID=4565 RepID=UPI001ABC5302|nr:uncharacterized protein LOC123099868 isoform X2 [Triticum aestivum]XP_045083170.1 uncharacterized protein LOC109765175 isoform X2 [Aegilops tauschii subsp. strangulata]
MQTNDGAKRDELHYSNKHILESAHSAFVLVALEENYSKEVGGLIKSNMWSLKRPYESQPQSFIEVRGGAMRIAPSRSRAVASSCQLRRSVFLPKTGNATGAAATSLNLFMLAPDKLSSMLNPADKDSDQDSLLEVAAVAELDEVMASSSFFRLMLLCPQNLGAARCVAATPYTS